MKINLAVLLLSAQLAGAASTYYVDFAAGNDSSAGTSTGTAWRTIPGTYLTNSSDLLNTAWGSINAGNRIGDNTTIKLKSGTIHSYTNGGFIWIGGSSASLYTDGCSNIVIETDTTWGDGTPSIIDGTAYSDALPPMLIQSDGVTVRGVTVRNSYVGGILAKEKGDGSALTNIVFQNIITTNCGLSYLTDAAGSGDGHLKVRRAYGVTVSNCVVSGANQYINGFLFGDSSKEVRDIWVQDCVATNLLGDLANNDSGIGFKCLNVTGTFTNCVSADNLKGFDCGEDGGSTSIDVKINRCIALRNQWGINANGPSAAYASTIKFYIFNNIVVSNAYNGLNIYAGPFSCYLVNNVIIYNGFGNITNGAGTYTGLYDGGQVCITAGQLSDTNRIDFVCLNNVLHEGPTNCATFLNKYGNGTNHLNLTIDFNSYDQAGSVFAEWGAYVSDTPYTYGANGPGQTSGDWYSQYYTSTTPPTFGTGHYHNDSNSKGKLCSVTTLAPVSSSYSPTNSYAGTNYSGASWYIAAMGKDRNGVSRSEWTVGAYEYVPSEPDLPTVSSQRKANTIYFTR